MRLTFRAKLIALVAVEALAVIAMLLASSLSERQVDRELHSMRQRLLPRIALKPQLEASFERVSRSFQDAASAREPDRLDDARRHQQALLDQLAAAGDAISAPARAELRTAFHDYYVAANAVSRQLLADDGTGEGGEAMVGDMEAMQALQTRARALIDRFTGFDQRELVEAFTVVADAQRTASRIRLAVSAVCLVSALLLSIWIARGVVRNLSALVAGFARFGAGDFATPIAAATGDEIGELARHANHMAASLQALDDETRALLLKTQRQAAELAAANKELDAFAYSVSHDLKAPLRAIDGFSDIVVQDYGDKLDDKGREHLGRVRAASQRMGHLIEDLLRLSRLSRAELRREAVDLSELARTVVADLRKRDPDRSVDLEIASGLTTSGDARLLRIVLENLFGNAWKFTRNAAAPRIRFGTAQRDGRVFFCVADNGAGFDMAYAGKLFAPFQRLHTAQEFEGTGIGLATVQRIIARHGGRIAAEGELGKGATILFTVEELAT